MHARAPLLALWACSCLLSTRAALLRLPGRGEDRQERQGPSALHPGTLGLLGTFAERAGAALRGPVRHGADASRRPCAPGDGRPPYPTYRPARRWPEDPGAATGAIVLAVGGPRLPFRKVPEAWTSWKRYFLPAVANSTALVLVLSEASHGGSGELVAALGLAPLDCRGLARACSLAGSLDAGYELYTAPLGGPGPDALVLVTVRPFPDAYWVGRANTSEAALLRGRWTAEHCYPTTYDYVKYTTWYGYGLFQLQALDAFDFWFKVDDDVAFHKPLPFDLARLMAQDRHILFHTTLSREPPDCVGPHLAHAAQLFLDTASDLCGRPLAARGAAAPWYTDDTLVFYSNFMGGWLGFFASPEYLAYARLWTHYPQGRFTYRWGDQQIWPKAVALFHTVEQVRDLSFLRAERYFSHPT